MRVVAFEDRNRLLQHNHAVVELLIHKMHRAPGHLYAVSKSLLLRIQTGKRRQERRMNIQDALRKGLYKFRRQQPHVSSQADQIDIVFPQAGNNFRIMLRPRPSIARAFKPSARAGSSPGASALFEITTAIAQPLGFPCAMFSAMARKFEPRPESKIPRRDIGADISRRSPCGRPSRSSQSRRTSRLPVRAGFWRG